MIYQKILILLVRGIDVRDIAEIERVSTQKVLSVLISFNRKIKGGHSRACFSDGLKHFFI